MRGRIVFWVSTVIAALLPLISCDKEEVLVRTSDNFGVSFHTIIGTNMIISAFFDSSFNMIDCQVQRKNTIAPKQFYKEIVWFRENSNVRYITGETDVRKLGRKCQKFIRDMRRKRTKDLVSAIDKTGKERLSLDELIEGTNWCSRKPQKQRRKTVGDNKELDKCCMSYQLCDHKVDAFTYGYGALNPFPWTIVSCDCVQAFKNCVKEEGSEKALQYERILIDNMRLPCLKLQDSDICEEYSDWMDKCIRWTKKPTASYAYNDN